MKVVSPLTSAVVALAAILVGVFVFSPTSCRLGVPHVDPKEVYAKDGSASFDHSLFDEVLAEFVTKDGLIRYQELSRNIEKLDQYIVTLAEAPFEDLGRNDKLAFLINSYNACTLRLILDHFPLKSIKDIPADERWEGRTWKLGGRKLSLHEIEHNECRAKFIEPRIHFAINCASLGCPPLRREAYVGARLDQQLNQQTTMVLNDKRWCRVDPGSTTITVTRLLSWYEEDFPEPLSAYVARHRKDLGAGLNYEVRFLDYDWSLNVAR